MSDKGVVIPADQWPEGAVVLVWDDDGGPAQLCHRAGTWYLKPSDTPMPAGWDWRVPMMRPSAEEARAQSNMDAGWYARREAHAHSMGYAGVADALEDLEARRNAAPPSAPVGVWCGECRGTGEVCTGTIDGTPELFDCDRCGGTGNSLAQQPAAVDEAAAIRAFEEHFQASAEDPYFEGELELWLAAWRAALAAQQPAGVMPDGISDDVIKAVWRAAMTGAHNVCVNRSNRWNDDDGPNDRITEANECAKEIAHWLEADEGFIAEIRAALAAQQQGGRADG